MIDTTWTPVIIGGAMVVGYLVGFWRVARTTIATIDEIASEPVRHVTKPHPLDGSFVEAQLTDEGVIVDTYDADGNCVHTFARMYDEFEVFK